MVLSHQNHDQVVGIVFVQMFDDWYCHDLPLSAESVLQDDAVFLDVL